MLDEFCEQYKYERKYAAKLLGDRLPEPKGVRRSGPESTYHPLMEVVERIWNAAEQLCGLSPAEMSALPRVEQLRHYDATIAAWMEERVHLERRPTAASFRAEVAGWLREVVARPVRSQRLLVVTSAGVIAAVVAEVLELPVERMSQFTRVLRNASLTEIAFSAGRPSLVSFNSVTHLLPALASGI